MADKKVSALDALTAPLRTDLAFVVADPATTPLDRKATALNVARGLIPGLSGNPNLLGASGGSVSEEYDSATTGLTWTAAPTTVDANTTIKSHLFVGHTAAGAWNIIGDRAFAPAAAFDARCHLTFGGIVNSSAGSGLILCNAAKSLMAMTWAYWSGATYPVPMIQGYTYSGGSWTARSGLCVSANDFYLRVTRGSSNDMNFYWSDDGNTWYRLNQAGAVSFTFTPTTIGYRLSGNGTLTEMCSDWLRATP